MGRNGSILKTSNSGQSWLAQSSGTTRFLRSVQFSDAQTGWAVGDTVTILKTSNGGQSWLAQNSGTSHDLFSVHFSNGQTGWAVGTFGTILKYDYSGAVLPSLSTVLVSGITQTSAISGGNITASGGPQYNL